MQTSVIALIALLVGSPVATAGELLEVEGVLVVTGCAGASVDQLARAEPPPPDILDRASACAKMGMPVAVLSHGTLFTLASPAAMLARHIAKPARLSGEEVAPRVIVPERLEVETEPDGWREVATTTMM